MTFRQPEKKYRRIASAVAVGLSVLGGYFIPNVISEANERTRQRALEMFPQEQSQEEIELRQFYLEGMRDGGYKLDRELEAIHPDWRRDWRNPNYEKESEQLEKPETRGEIV